MQRDNSLFTNDTGNMRVGLWNSVAFESELSAFLFHEFVQLIESEIVVTEESGSVHRFIANDAFFTPMGTVCKWKTTSYIKKYYSIVDPNIKKAYAD